MSDPKAAKKKGAKSRTTTLKSANGADTLTIRASENRSGQFVVSVHYQVGDGPKQRGLTSTHDSSDSASRKRRDLVKKSLESGWVQASRGRKEDAFDAIPAA